MDPSVHNDALSRPNSNDVPAPVTAPAVEVIDTHPRPAHNRWGTHRWALVVVVAVVLIAHLPYLTGAFNANPMLTDSGLGTHITSGVLPGLSTIDPNAGFISQGLAHRNAESWLHGHVPWWNPDEGLGTPAAGEMSSSGLFLPFVLLTYFVQGDVLLFLLLCLIAAVSTYFLLSRLAMRPAVCVAGAVAFGLNGTMAWLRISPNYPICFLPLMLLGVELIRSGVTRGQATRWWLVAIGLAGSLYAGFPEMALLDGLVVVVWVLVRLQGLPRDELRRYAGGLVSATVVGLLLAAPILVAFLDFLPHAYIGPHTGAVAKIHLGGSASPAFLFPYVYGPIYGFAGAHSGAFLVGMWNKVGGFLTVATVLLAVLGLWGRTYRMLRLALAAASVVMVGRIYGVHPFLTLFNLLPGMTHVAAERYLDPAIALMMIVLAAFGMEAILDRQLRPPQVAASFVSVGAVAGLLALRASRMVGGLTGWAHHDLWAGASFGWAGLTVLLILAGTLLPRRAVARWALIAVLPVESVAMFAVPEFSAPRGGQVSTGAVTWLQEHIGLGRFYTLGPIGANYGSYFGIAELDTNDLPDPTTWNNIIRHQLDPNADAVNFQGTVSLNPKGPSTSEAFEKNLDNYEKFGVAYLLVSSRRSPPHTDPPLQLVYDDQVADIYQLPSTRPFFSEPTGRSTISPSSWTRAVIDSPSPTTVTRLEVAMPGWSATVNGKQTPVVADPDGMQTISVPAGRSTIAFRFTPPFMNLAEAGLVVGVLACMAPWGFQRVRARRTRSTPTTPGDAGSEPMALV